MRPLCFSPNRYFLLLVGLALTAMAADKPSKPGPAEDFGRVVALSPFEVSAQSMEFSHWVKLGSPHFLLYTDASSKEAKEIIKHLEMIHQAAQFFLKRRSTNFAPVMIVLPTGSSDWKKIKSKGTVEWSVATSMGGEARRMVLAEYDWQNDGLGSVWAMVGINEVEAMNLDLPLWGRRGIASFFRTVTFSGDSLTMGKQDFETYYVQKYGWMDWPRFYHVTAKSPEFFKQSTEHNKYEGQCTVLVHYVLTHSDPKWTPRLLAWAAFLNAGNEPTEESFKKIFGCDFEAWQQQMDDLLHGGTYTTGNIKFPPAALKFEVTSAVPSAREMRELFVLAQIMNQNTKESDASLEAVLKRGLKTESLREFLAEACEERHRSSDQLEQLRRVIDSGSTNPAVFARAARRLLESKKAENWMDTRLNEETTDIRTWCRRALELEPLQLEANETLAWAEAFAPQVEKGNLETIVGICRALDGNAPTDNALAALAVARWRKGQTKQALSLCERLKSSVMSRKRAKEIANDVLARLDSNAAKAPELSASSTVPAAGGVQ
jgi:hypothetical protein